MLTVPNILSFIRLLGVPLFLWLLLIRESEVWAVVVLIVGGGTDWLDGYLARRWSQRSRLGQVLDPLADRLYILATLIGFAIREIVPWWLVVLLAARDVLMVVSIGRRCAAAGSRASPSTSSARPRPSPCSTASPLCCSAQGTSHGTLSCG